MTDSTEDQDPLAAAVAEVRERNEWRIRVQLFTEWTVENDAPEGDVRRLLAALEHAIAWVPREERGHLAALLRKQSPAGNRLRTRRNCQPKADKWCCQS